VIAIATLSLLYHNPQVFKDVVKIRKGLSCKIMLNSRNIPEVYGWFHSFADKIIWKINTRSYSGMLDPNHNRTMFLCSRIKELSTSTSISLFSKFFIGMMPNNISAELDTDSLSPVHADVVKLKQVSISQRMPSLRLSHDFPYRFLKALNYVAWLVFLASALYLMLFNYISSSTSNDHSNSHSPLASDHDLSSVFSENIFNRPSAVYIAMIAASISIGYLFGFFGMTYV